jgi:AcrR family transcriptional regulator
MPIAEGTSGGAGVDRARSALYPSVPMSVQPAGRRRPGRPRADEALDVAQILAATLQAFARDGYEGVSVRTLSKELGVSHNLLHARFGSKPDLWRAAVDHGFGQMTQQMLNVFDPTITDPIEQAKRVIRRFVIFSAEHPELLGLMDIEGRQNTERLDYLYERYLKPSLAGIEALLEYLIAAGQVRKIEMRQLHFIVAHGAIALYTLVPLAERFDPRSPFEPGAVQAHADLIADFVVDGLTRRT